MQVGPQHTLLRVLLQYGTLQRRAVVQVGRRAVLKPMIGRTCQCPPPPPSCPKAPPAVPPSPTRPPLTEVPSATSTDMLGELWRRLAKALRPRKSGAARTAAEASRHSGEVRLGAGQGQGNQQTSRKRRSECDGLSCASKRMADVKMTLLLLRIPSPAPVNTRPCQPASAPWQMRPPKTIPHTPSLHQALPHTPPLPVPVPPPSPPNIRPHPDPHLR